MTQALNSLSNQTDLVFSHIGLYVENLDRMAQFYIEVMGFIQTDRGDLGNVQLVFLSRDPAEHHQLVLASGKPAHPGFNIINQLSFRVPNLNILRSMRDRARTAEGISELFCVTHGNAVSIYFRDPEGNRIEIFMDTPWYCEQPMREPIDLDQSDDAIMAHAEALARSRPRFQTRESWQAEMRKRMGFDVH